MKKQFLISSSHDVYVENYHEGEQGYANGYDLKEIISADNWKEAVNIYFEKTLFLNLGVENCEIDTEFNYLRAYCLVKGDNSQPTNKEIKAWENEEITLYSNNICIQVKEIIDTILN